MVLMAFGPHLLVCARVLCKVEGDSTPYPSSCLPELVLLRQALDAQALYDSALSRQWGLWGGHSPASEDNLCYGLTGLLRAAPGCSGLPISLAGVRVTRGNLEGLPCTTLAEGSFVPRAT